MNIVKWIIGGGLAASAVAVLIAGSKQIKPEPEGFVTIQYWEKWTEFEAEGMQAVISRFNNTVGKEKKIFVRYVSMSQIDQKTLVATAAGVPPDIAGLWDGQLAQFAAKDALEPLDDLAAEYHITRDQYKPIYWDSNLVNGKLYGLVSTPAVIALHYNKEIFEQNADALRAKGLDPDRAPRSIAELDAYSDVLTKREGDRVTVFGYLPLEPGWYTTLMSNWFGGAIYDSNANALTIENSANQAAYKWVESYSQKYGSSAISEFRSAAGSYASATNPFMTSTLAMEQQGPWFGWTIEKFKPSMNRWHIPQDQLDREKAAKSLKIGMTFDQVTTLLKPDAKETFDFSRNDPVSTDFADRFTYDLGLQILTLRFDSDRNLVDIHSQYKPTEERKKFSQWAAAPFPTVDGRADVGYCTFDTLAIPKGSKHKKEAFEFIRFVQQREMMEQLCMSHRKNSPLIDVSEAFIKYHPNPYIEVFETLALAQGAFGVPKTPMWPEVNEELTVAVQRVATLEAPPQSALRDAAKRAGDKFKEYHELAARRRGGAR